MKYIDHATNSIITTYEKIKSGALVVSSENTDSLIDSFFGVHFSI